MDTDKPHAILRLPDGALLLLYADGLRVRIDQDGSIAYWIATNR